MSQTPWEKEFDLKFAQGFTDMMGTFFPNRLSIDLKDFISSLLIQTRQEVREETIDECIKICVYPFDQKKLQILKSLSTK